MTGWVPGRWAWQAAQEFWASEELTPCSAQQLLALHPPKAVPPLPVPVQKPPN